MLGYVSDGEVVSLARSIGWFVLGAARMGTVKENESG